jgi:hypothetical protein
VIETDNIVKFDGIATEYQYDASHSILLISNFRNRNYAADPSTEEMVLSNANIILSDMELQKRIFHQIKPEFALLLFRPLISAEVKLTKNNSFSYLTGMHLLLPYAKHKINTTMLMICKDATEAIYFHDDITRRLKYHNINTRNNNVYPNPYTHLFNSLISLEEVKAYNLKLDLGDEHYVMNCGWDCRYAYFVFHIYLTEIRGMMNVKKEILDGIILRYFSLLENARNT